MVEYVGVGVKKKEGEKREKMSKQTFTNGFEYVKWIVNNRHEFLFGWTTNNQQENQNTHVFHLKMEIIYTTKNKYLVSTTFFFSML